MPGAGGCVDHGIASPALAATARAWQLQADWLRDVAPGWRARLPVFAPSRAVVLRHVAARLLAAPVLAVCQLVFFAHFHVVAGWRGAARRRAVVLLLCAHRPHFRASRRLGVPVARERQGAAVRLLAEASPAELADWRAAEKIW